MTIEEAVEVLKKHAQEHVDSILRGKAGIVQGPRYVADALAALEGLHLYGSRFKPGDEVWDLEARFDEWSVRHRVIRTVAEVSTSGFLNFENGGYANESNCFPTRAEAEAECERRNKR